MTPTERDDFMTIAASIQRRPGENWDDWQSRYRRFEETGETYIPDDVRGRLRQPGESLEDYLSRLKSGGDDGET